MIEILQQIGLSKNESKIYVTLSEIGLSSAYKIAKQSNIFKSNTYDTLKRLIEKGLVSHKTIEDKELYETTDPSYLLEILNKKRELANQIIPQLRLIQQTDQSHTKFNSYKGADAVISILTNFLKYKEPIYVYGAPKIAFEILKHRITNFHKERIKKKIKMYHIYNFEATSRIKTLQKMPYTPIKVLPELFDTQVTTMICGDETTFTIWNPPIKVMQIVDEEMSKAYIKYFQILWKQAKI